MNKFLDLDDQKKVIISDIFPNSPAEKGGLQPYDIIISINNNEINNSSQLKIQYLLKDHQTKLKLLF